MSLKVIAFDLFGTLLDMSNVRREEIKSYLKQCVDPVWQALVLPDSWKELKAFPDVREGIIRLNKKFKTVTLSNAPSELTHKILSANKLPFYDVIGLESIKRYKPHPECYSYCAEVMGLNPEEVMMVTANPTFGPYSFGDVQIAKAIGMEAKLIRDKYCKDVVQLAELLDC